jgi:hypothetical protein
MGSGCGLATAEKWDAQATPGGAMLFIPRFLLLQCLSSLQNMITMTYRSPTLLLTEATMTKMPETKKEETLAPEMAM